MVEISLCTMYSCQRYGKEFGTAMIVVTSGLKLKMFSPSNARVVNVGREDGTMEAAILQSGLVALRQQIATERGTQPACPFCQRPRVKRSDYTRCNPCGINWLDAERNLPNYLNRNPAAARSSAPMDVSALPPAAI